MEINIPGPGQITSKIGQKLEQVENKVEKGFSKATNFVTDNLEDFGQGLSDLWNNGFKINLESPVDLDINS